MLKKYKHGEKAPENKDMKIYMFWIYFPTYAIAANEGLYRDQKTLPNKL